MKQLIPVKGVFFLLTWSAVFGQVPVENPTNTNPGGPELFFHDTLPASQQCGTEVPPEYRPSPTLEGRCLAVKEYMRYPSPISPIGDLTLAMMGDEAAFWVYTIVETMPPLTPAQTLTVMDILHNSFKRPVAIRSEADRKPVKALALLKTIQATAVDQVVKERIAAETTFLTTLPEKITPVPISNLPAKSGAMPMSEDFQKPEPQ